MKIILPHPPSLNRKFVFGGKKPRNSSDVKDYYWQVKALGVGNKPMEGRLDVQIIVHAPDKRKRDMDNILKVSLDAMEKANYYTDDSQIDCLRVMRGISNPRNPHLEVFISESKIIPEDILMQMLFDNKEISSTTALALRHSNYIECIRDDGLIYKVSLKN